MFPIPFLGREIHLQTGILRISRKAKQGCRDGLSINNDLMDVGMVLTHFTTPLFIPGKFLIFFSFKIYVNLRGNNAK